MKSEQVDVHVYMFLLNWQVLALFNFVGHLSFSVYLICSIVAYACILYTVSVYPSVSYALVIHRVSIIESKRLQTTSPQAIVSKEKMYSHMICIFGSVLCISICLTLFTSLFVCVTYTFLYTHKCREQTFFADFTGHHLWLLHCNRRFGLTSRRPRRVTMQRPLPCLKALSLSPSWYFGFKAAQMTDSGLANFG